MVLCYCGNVVISGGTVMCDVVILWRGNEVAWYSVEMARMSCFETVTTNTGSTIHNIYIQYHAVCIF